MEKIIVYLHNADLSLLSWAIINDNGVPQKITAQGDIPALAAAASNKEVFVVAPPEDVLLVEAKLPKLNRQRMLQALPFALEEQLLTDISELHFAVGEYQANNTLPVAIIAKAKIEAWLKILKEVDIEPTCLIPAPLILPLSENDWYIQLRDNSAIVRTGLYSGFACDKHNLEALITLNKAEQAEVPHAIYLINNDAAPFLAEKEGLKELVTEKRLTDKQQFSDIAQQCELPVINLLQGDFQAKRTTSHSKKIWLLAGYVAAGWLALVLVSNIISYLILHHEYTKIDTAINTIYTHNFPHAASIVAPKKRMTEKLNNLMNQNHKNRLLVWMAYIGKDMTETNTIKIRQLDYRSSLLNLEVSAPNFESIDSFTQALTQQSLSVKQQNVAASGKEVKGSLLITDGNQS
jgi:general secretion pathway protein L